MLQSWLKILFNSTTLYNKAANLYGLVNITGSKGMNASNFYEIKHWDPPTSWPKQNINASRRETRCTQRLVMCAEIIQVATSTTMKKRFVILQFW